MARPKKVNEYQACPICGSAMPVVYSCNIEVFSGRAGWHLNFNPRINMCSNCSNELLKSINSWYKKQNKTGLNDKFKI